MKLYTKTGDKGQTSLIGGKRVPKYDDRIEAYGTVDELNATLGLVYNDCIDTQQKQLIAEIQNNLFEIGSYLACDPSGTFKIELNFINQATQQLEDNIDLMNESLPELRAFILPSGNLPVAHCHLARTVCRRAERRVVALAIQESIDENVIIYLNRLSDYLFVLARFMAFLYKVPEVKWTKK